MNAMNATPTAGGAGTAPHTPMPPIYRPSRRFKRLCSRRHARMLTTTAAILETTRSRGRIPYQVCVSRADGTTIGVLYLDVTMCGGGDFAAIYRAAHGGEL